MSTVWFSQMILVAGLLVQVMPGTIAVMPIRDADEKREYQRAWRAARRVAGMCYECEDPAIEGKTRCADCAVKTRDRGIAQRAARRVRGLCVICGKPVRTSHLCCQECVSRQGNRQQRFKQAVLDYYGRACVCCGESEETFLCVDHINNDGSQHRKEIGVGSKLMEWLVRQGFPEGFQMLCWNCNAGKYLNGGICPHKAAVA